MAAISRPAQTSKLPLVCGASVSASFSPSPPTSPPAAGWRGVRVVELSGYRILRSRVANSGVRAASHLAAARRAWRIRAPRRMSLRRCGRRLAAWLSSVACSVMAAPSFSTAGSGRRQRGADDRHHEADRQGHAGHGPERPPARRCERAHPACESDAAELLGLLGRDREVACSRAEPGSAQRRWRSVGCPRRAPRNRGRTQSKARLVPSRTGRRRPWRSA